MHQMLKRHIPSSQGSNRASAGRLLEIGFALTLLTAPGAFAGPAPAAFPKPDRAIPRQAGASAHAPLLLLAQAPGPGPATGPAGPADPMIGGQDPSLQSPFQPSAPAQPPAE